MRFEASITSILERRSRAWLAEDRHSTDSYILLEISLCSTKRKKKFTFQLAVIGVSREEHIREELLKAVSSIARPVFNIRSDRLVQLHQKVLRWGAQLLNNFVPLIDV